MSDEELNTIASDIHQLAGAEDAWAKARKLLRSIEIAALREALEVMRENVSHGDYISLSAIGDLETKLRNLELK